MSSVSIQGNASGTGIFTIASPNSNTNRTLTLPDATGTIITTAGGAAISGTTGSFTTTVGVGGATPSASGAGITFPASASPSSNANTLDDYEEGTWTPTVRGEGSAGTTTYTLQEGFYTKIGDTVFLYCRVTYSAATGTGTLQIKGVPFNNVDRVTAGSVRTSSLNLINGTAWVVPTLQDNSATIVLNGCSDDAAENEVTLSNESAGIMLQITYRV